MQFTLGFPYMPEISGLPKRAAGSSARAGASFFEIRILRRLIRSD